MYGLRAYVGTHESVAKTTPNHLSFVGIRITASSKWEWYISVTEPSRAFRSAAAGAAVRAAARHQRPLRPLLMAETGLWGPCASPAHARSTAASTVDADIMLSMTSAVARHCISPRCCWYTPAGLGHPDVRRAHSGDGAECARRQAVCPRPAGVYQQHRSACSAHGTLTQAPRGVVPEPGTRATGRVLCSAGHGHRVLSISVQDRPCDRSDRPYPGSR